MHSDLDITLGLMACAVVHVVVALILFYAYRKSQNPKVKKALAVILALIVPRFLYKHN